MLWLQRGVPAGCELQQGGCELITSAKLFILLLTTLTFCHIKLELLVFLHTTTISHLFHKTGLYGQMARKKPLLTGTDKNRKAHFEFAKRYLGDAVDLLSPMDNIGNHPGWQLVGEAHKMIVCTIK